MNEVGESSDDGRRRGRYINSPVDRAAGGVLVYGGKVAVVHRPRYDDWSLPKGHVRSGESWQAAALREVAEETGVTARLLTSGRPYTYLVGHELPKVVMFYAMVPAEPPQALTGDLTEVDEACWWDPTVADERLSYDVEIDALRALWPIAAAADA